MHRHYLQTRYSVYHRDSVPVSCLVERTFELLAPGSACFAVLPGGWLRSNSFRAMRAMLSGRRIHSIADILFISTSREKDMHYSIIAASPAHAGGNVAVARVRFPLYGSLDPFVRKRTYFVPQEMLGPGGWSLADRRLFRLRKKIAGGRPPLEEYVMGEIYAGNPPCGKDAVLSRTQVDDLRHSCPGQSHILQPYISGGSVSRYEPLKAERFLLDGPGILPERRDTSRPPVPESIPDRGPKLVIGVHRSGISCTFHRGGFIHGRGVLLVPGVDLYLLGILNSCIASFYFAHALARNPSADIMSLVRRIPVHVVDPSERNEELLHWRIVDAVKRILTLNRELDRERREKSRIRSRISEIDREIDMLCLRLYGLSDEEIQVLQSLSGEGSARADP